MRPISMAILGIVSGVVLLAACGGSSASPATVNITAPTLTTTRSATVVPVPSTATITSPPPDRRATSTLPSDPTAEGTELPVLTSERSLPAGQPLLFEIGTHCGVGYLGLPVNGKFWVTDEPARKRDWIPAEWADTLDEGDELITIEVVLSTDGTELVATKAGRSVVYRPQTANDPQWFCD